MISQANNTDLVSTMIFSTINMIGFVGLVLWILLTIAAFIVSFLVAARAAVSPFWTSRLRPADVTKMLLILGSYPLANAVLVFFALTHLSWVAHPNYGWLFFTTLTTVFLSSLRVDYVIYWGNFQNPPERHLAVKTGATSGQVPPATQQDDNESARPEKAEDITVVGAWKGLLILLFPFAYIVSMTFRTLGWALGESDSMGLHIIKWILFSALCLASAGCVLLIALIGVPWFKYVARKFRDRSTNS